MYTYIYTNTVRMLICIPSYIQPEMMPRDLRRAETSKASAGREVKRVARETRDAMVLLRHTAKHGEQQARNMRQVGNMVREMGMGLGNGWV